jgi:hypothetical protein
MDMFDPSRCVSNRRIHFQAPSQLRHRPYTSRPLANEIGLDADVRQMKLENGCELTRAAMPQPLHQTIDQMMALTDVSKTSRHGSIP